jgi:hypothetical protein
MLGLDLGIHQQAKRPGESPAIVLCDGSIETAMTKIARNQTCPCGSGEKFKFCHGLNKPLPAPENIASISLSSELKRVVVVTKDILINQIFRDGPLIAKSFDRLARKDIEDISAVIADAMSLMFAYSIIDSKEYKPTCTRLLSSALSAFMASVEVARHGFRRPYGAIARNVMELLATVLHIAMELDALTNFHAGRLQSTKSISVANKALPPFGHAYGMFSQHFVHINTAHAALEPIKSYQQGEEPLAFIVSTLRANAWLIYVVAELIFHDEIPRPRYWRHLGQGAFVYDPSETERAWQKEFLDPPGETDA